KAQVSIFNVPQSLQDQQFTITAENDGAYTLTHEDTETSLQGKVGETLKAQTADGEIELRIDTLAANPGAQFYVTRSERWTTIENLQRDLKISEKGKQSGIISVALEGSDRQLTSTILNEI